MKNILLIGGNGYIGSRLYEHLLSENYNVTNVDTCWYGKVYKETIEANYDTLSKEFINSFSHVILLAAHSSVAMCSKGLMPCFENNVVNFIKLLEKLDTNQTLLYSSTAAVYGSSDKVMIETDPLTNAINYYDYTKICNENIVNLYPNKNIIGLRYGSLGGFSKNFRNENLLNSISASAFKNNKITISNPDKLRAVLGITDLCRAFSTLLAQDKIKHKIYNLVSLNSKIIDFGKAIQSITGCDLEINNTFQTNYSFNCSSALFEHDYGFKFTDTVETIYRDIVDNYNNILINSKRESRD